MGGRRSLFNCLFGVIALFTFVFALAMPVSGGSDTVAAVLVLESATEGKVGMERVQDVIINRSNERQKSLFEVVTQPKQFSCLNKIPIPRAIELASSHPKWEQALKISQRTNALTRFNHYHTIDVSPYWAKGKTGERIGRHIFYRL